MSKKQEQQLFRFLNIDRESYLGGWFGLPRVESGSLANQIDFPEDLTVMSETQSPEFVHYYGDWFWTEDKMSWLKSLALASCGRRVRCGAVPRWP
jgi:hypothetical protein